MSSSRLKPKAPRRCIFCGGKKVTGEHIWPDWAAPLFEGTPATGVVEGYGVSHPGHSPIMSYATHQGRTNQKKIYYVCGRCNSGWMSLLEDEAKPLILKLQAADAFSLNSAEQLTVARWLTLKIMVAEHSRREQAIIPQAARTEFMDSLALPAGLRIWLMRCGMGRWRSGYMRIATTAKRFHASQIIKVANEEHGPPNVSSVAFGFNELFAYASYTTLSDLKLDLEAGDRFGVRIWPPAHDVISWPPPLTLDGAAADAVADTLRRLPRFTSAP